MSAVRRARDARLAAPDRGASLTELLVVMLITSIVMVTAVSMTIAFQRTTAQNITRQDQVDAARVAIERIAKTARTVVKPSKLAATCATAFCEQTAIISGGTRSVVFFANLDNKDNLVGPSRVTYALSTTGATAGQLVEKVQRPDSAVPGTAGYTYCAAELASSPAACKARLTTRVLATGVVASVSEPIFTYYNTDGVRLLPVTATDSLAAGDLGNVLSLELQVRVRAASGSSTGPTTYIQRVTLPNSQAVIRQGTES